MKNDIKLIFKRFVIYLSVLFIGLAGLILFFSIPFLIGSLFMSEMLAVLILIIEVAFIMAVISVYDEKK